MTRTAPSDPLVSIIMPVWKPHPEWFPTAVSSVLRQTGGTIELIIIDDGNDVPVDLPPGVPAGGWISTRIIRITHGGVNAARNAGLRAARGDWIRYVDSDDVVTADGTRRLRNAGLGHPDAGLVFGDTLRCDEDLAPRRIDRCRLHRVSATDCLLGRFNAWLPAMLFPRHVAEAVGEWDESLEVSSDWDYVLRSLEHGFGYRVPEQVYYYRQHHASLSTSGERGRGSRAARRIVEGYLARHPEQRRSRVGRTALRRLEAHEFRDSLAGQTWWRSRTFWTGVATRPWSALYALPALVRSSIPGRLEAALFRFIHRRSR